MDDITINIVNQQDYVPAIAEPTWQHCGSGGMTTYVQMDSEAFIYGHKHTLSSSKELGGIMVGSVVQWNNIYYVSIQSLISSPSTDHSEVHITFTADDWADMMNIKAKYRPDTLVLGWYHSHPNIGIFLSEWDLSIHRNFFNDPYYIALVYNPQETKAGLFSWQGDSIALNQNICFTKDAQSSRELVKIKPKSKDFSYEILEDKEQDKNV